VKAVFIDIETTGLDFETHVPIDIAVAVVDLNVMEDMHTYATCITCDASDWELADKKALEVNGYNQENFPKDSKDPWTVGKEIQQFLYKHEIVRGRAFFICQNPSFDRPFFLQLICQKTMSDLNLPYHWLDLASMYWIKYYGSCFPVPSPDSPYKDLCYEVSLSKDSIAASLGLPPEERPHKALNGVKHLIACYNRVCSYNYCFPPKVPD
jgi:DNA polymerase-3 subunit epsilon/oligoribonuclease